MKYIVYQTTNLINNKIYIGVHKTENPDVFDGYIGNGAYVNKPSTYNNPDTPFKFALKKYGVKNFNRKVLYIFDSAEEAYAKEEQLVDVAFVKMENNYNISLGGGNIAIISYPINQFDEQGILVKHWDFLVDAMDEFGVTRNAFYTAMHFKERLKGFYWSRESEIDISQYSHTRKAIRVYKYSKDGKCLEIYESIIKAAKENNLGQGELSTYIQQESLVRKMFYFSTSLVDEFKPKPRISLKGKSFYVYALDGNFIDKFESAKSLMTYLNIHSYNIIHRAIDSRNGLYKEYQIKLEDLGSKIEPVEQDKDLLPKPIDVYLASGEFYKHYDAVNTAVKELNLKGSSVNRVLRGLAKTTGGYTMKYS